MTPDALRHTVEAEHATLRALSDAVLDEIRAQRRAGVWLDQQPLMGLQEARAYIDWAVVALVRALERLRDTGPVRRD